MARADKTAGWGPDDERSGTLCWNCGNAVPDREGVRGCPWSRKLTPVEGWQALRRDLRVRTGSDERTESYLVLRCPLFQPDPPRARPARAYLVRRVKKDGAGRVFLGPETRFVTRDDLPEGGFCLLGSQRRQWCFVVRELPSAAGGGVP